MSEKNGPLLHDRVSGVTVWLYVSTHNIEILNQSYWHCRILSLLRSATIREFQSRDLYLDLRSGHGYLSWKTHRPLPRYQDPSALVNLREWTLQIWPNRLSRVSRDRSPGEKSKILFQKFRLPWSWPRPWIDFPVSSHVTKKAPWKTVGYLSSMREKTRLTNKITPVREWGYFRWSRRKSNEGKVR